MSSIDEKRVYAEQSGTVTAYVAAKLGLTAVSISGDIVGEFTLIERCEARDVAVTPRGVAVATDTGVKLGDGEQFESLNSSAKHPLESPTAVTSHGGDVLAADDNGNVARYDGEWTLLGTVEGVHSLDGNFVAADDGVHRVTGDSLAAAGLADVRDIASDGTPYAATPDGLFRLGNGWMDAISGAFHVVDSATVQSGENTGSARDTVAHAATSDTFYEYGESGWHERALPVEETITGIAYGPNAGGNEHNGSDTSEQRCSRAVVAVTEDGTLLVDAGDGFRHRSLGLQGTQAVAIVVDTK